MDSDLVVVAYGLAPSPDCDVLAYGNAALQVAHEEGIIVEGPVNWDGASRHGPAGGQYAVLDRRADQEALERIADAHEFPDEFPDDIDGVSAVADDGSIVECPLLAVGELN